MRNQKGFSLVELMVASGVAGILMAVSITQLTAWQEKAKNSRRYLDMAKIKAMVETYRREFTTYPVGTRSSNPGDANYVAADYVVGMNPDLLPRDVAESTPFCIPIPNVTDRPPAYFFISDGTDYKILNHCASRYYNNYADPARSSGGLVWGIAIYTSGAAAF